MEENLGSATLDDIFLAPRWSSWRLVQLTDNASTRLELRSRRYYEIVLAAHLGFFERITSKNRGYSNV